MEEWKNGMVDEKIAASCRLRVASYELTLYYLGPTTCDRSSKGWSGIKKKETVNRKHFMSLLRMRCYSDDRDHSSLRTVIPEDPVGSWCFLLDICLEDLFPVRPFERPKFVRLQRGMAQVGFKKPQAFPDGFKNIPLRGIVFNLPKVGVGLRRENQFVHRLLFSVPGERSALDGSLLRKPGQDFL